MRRRALMCGVLVLTWIVGVGQLRADEPGETAKERLGRAIGLCDDGAYEAAHEILIGIDEDEIEGEAGQVQLQRYLSKTEQALAGIEEAKKDFAAAEAAEKADDKDQAVQLYTRVTENKYATKDAKDTATKKLDEFSKKSSKDAAPPPADGKIEKVTKATSSAPQNQTATWAPATTPSATKGGSSIVEELAIEHELLWQQAVQTYKEAARKLRVSVLKEDFAEAKRQLDFARETIELNRRYASPAARYEELRDQAVELERFLQDEQRNYDERVIREKQLEIQQRETDRGERIRNTKLKQVDALMSQAEELVGEQRLNEAIQVLDQILAIDPQNEQAAWKHETLSDLAQVRRIRATSRTKDREVQDLVAENVEAAIPWHNDINYPKNWPEIVAKRPSNEEASEPSRIDRFARNLAPWRRN